MSTTKLFHFWNMFLNYWNGIECYRRLRLWWRPSLPSSRDQLALILIESTSLSQQRQSMLTGQTQASISVVCRWVHVSVVNPKVLSLSRHWENHLDMLGNVLAILHLLNVDLDKDSQGFQVLTKRGCLKGSWHFHVPQDPNPLHLVQLLMITSILIAYFVVLSLHCSWRNIILWCRGC